MCHSPLDLRECISLRSLAPRPPSPPHPDFLTLANYTPCKYGIWRATKDICPKTRFFHPVRSSCKRQPKRSTPDFLHSLSRCAVACKILFCTNTRFLCSLAQTPLPTLLLRLFGRDLFPGFRFTNHQVFFFFFFFFFFFSCHSASSLI